ncbi:MAG: hypothetical protein QM734_03870 [Cyclobacteriaceae bacterium]
MKIIYCAILFFGFSSAYAQTDTITTKNLKLNLSKVGSLKHSYAVFFTDSLGNRLSTADIWDREGNVSKNNDGSSSYTFKWKWFRSDTLLMEAGATCKYPSMEPSDYFFTRKKQKNVVKYSNNIANVAGKSRKTQRDTTYNVNVGLAAFAFPMDLELFAMLPFKKVGQQFIVPFYEPASPKADYYKCSVIGKDYLKLTDDTKVMCWIMKIDYGFKGAHAKFWITDSSREVIKMQEYFNGRYRYKVKLY